MSARRIATLVLRRVATDGAWASRVLDNEIGRARLDARDAALATTITLGTLRHLPTIDAQIDAHAKKTDSLVRAVLRCAVFEILYLDRVPVRAAVNEAVNLVRGVRGPRVAGFVNALLRKIDRPDEALAATLELPAWIRNALEASVGKERAEAFEQHHGTALDLRVLSGDRDVWLEAIALARPEGTALPIGAHGIRVQGVGDPRRLPGFRKGAFVVQEYGSQCIVDLVELTESSWVADCCAGRGGKTVSLAARLAHPKAHHAGSNIDPGIDPKIDPIAEEASSAPEVGGHLTAIEKYEARAEQIPEAFKRLGLETSLTVETIDLTLGTGGLDGQFDQVLIDAPCTGLGTAYRRPELLLRVSPKAVDALVKLQRGIFENAMKLVKPGGTLTYAVCSFLSEEGPGSVGELPVGWRPRILAGADSDGWLRLGPWSDSDAYQVASWVRPPRTT